MVWGNFPLPFLSIYPKALKNSHFYDIILLDKLEFDEELDCMNKIIAQIKQMNFFQKVLLISALIPYYSCIIVNLVTYVVCWKKKLSFAPFVICFFAYGILMFLVINCNVLPLIKYIVSCFVALVGNYCLISLQMRDWKIPIYSNRLKAKARRASAFLIFAPPDRFWRSVRGFVICMGLGEKVAPGAIYAVLAHSGSIPKCLNASRIAFSLSGGQMRSLLLPSPML